MARMTNRSSSQTGRAASPQARAISPETRQHMIGEAAYYRYVHRGFAPGHDIDDWLEAEADFERTSQMRQPPEPATNPEFELQQSGARGPAADDALKRSIRQHPRRDISRIESIEPDEAPLKE